MNDTCICENVPKVWRLTGVTRTLRLRIFNPDGTPLDLTGREVAVTIARDNSEFVYSPGFVIEGDDGNVVKFEWPADQQGAGDYTINVTTTDGSGNVDRVNWHGPTGIRLVDFSFMVRGEDALGVTSEANIGLDGTFTMNGVGMSAYDEWLSSPESEGWPQTVSGFMAYLKQPATDAAAALEQVVNEKMDEVDETMDEVQEQADADHTRAESDHARAETDHTTATGDHTRAEADHAQAVTDSQRAATDHQQAESDAAAAASDREKAATDRMKAAQDRHQAEADHELAAQDHATAASDHQQAQSDHSTASADHTQAVQDSEQAASDHTRAGNDHDTAVADHQQAEADHTRAEQDHTASAAATGAANDAAQTATEAAEAADAARESIADELAKKANVEGYYGGLTAGSAENLVGRGSVEAEIQGIRTSAGQEDIGTGAAIIREVRGKSLVWNQMRHSDVYAFRPNTASLDISDNDIVVTSNYNGNGGDPIAIYSAATITSGHKMCVTFDFIIRTGGDGITGVFMEGFAGSTGTGSTDVPVISGNHYGTIVTPVISKDRAFLKVSGTKAVGDVWVFSNWNIFDLTLMFGAGNEPTTVEEFERMFFLPFYEFNAGTIINNEATGLLTRGFNLFNPVTGKAVLPGKYSDYPYEYEICGAFTSISFEDYAGNVSTPELSDGRFFNVPSPGVLTVVGGNATDTCVHLVWSGWRNYGEPDYVYEPYWENTLQLNLKTITGKLNGEGESVTIYPDGMRGVGTAYDRLIVDPDGFARRAVKVMESVDMGTLKWAVIGSPNYFVLSTNNLPQSFSEGTTGNNFLSSKYVTKPKATSATYYADDKVIWWHLSNNWICIHDSAYTDVATIKTALSGVLLDYRLATPLEYVLDTPIPLTYMVDDFGTEAKLPVDTAELPTGPLRFAVTYPFNAVDKLRRLSTNYLSKESTEAMLNALQSAGIIGGYTMTYNASTEQYTFTITAPSTTPDETTE